MNFLYSPFEKLVHLRSLSNLQRNKTRTPATTEQRLRALVSDQETEFTGHDSLLSRGEVTGTDISSWGKLELARPGFNFPNSDVAHLAMLAHRPSHGNCLDSLQESLN